MDVAKHRGTRRRVSEVHPTWRRKILAIEMKIIQEKAVPEMAPFLTIAGSAGLRQVYAAGSGGIRAGESIVRDGCMGFQPLMIEAACASAGRT